MLYTNILRPTAVTREEKGASFPDSDCYDDARTGFADMEESSPPAIREKASLMVSAVFVARCEGGELPLRLFDTACTCYRPFPWHEK
jgi:hypothetical protein